MKNWLIVALIACVAATTAPAEAKGLSGGKSKGMQRNLPARTAPDATPAKPATPPAQGQQATPAAAPATAAAPAVPPKRNWLGPIAGLAAGLGIAALLSHFGMGEAVSNMLMMALLAGAAVFLVMFLLRRFGPGRREPALAGAGAGATQVAWPAERVDAPRADTTLQRSALPAAAAAPAEPLAAVEPVGRVVVPAAFDSEGFARTAKMIFIRLQAANDTADLDDLRRFTTPELFASLRLDLQERGDKAQQTDVVDVAAQVLDVANEAERQVVSVRFHGHMVEERGAAPVAFDEVWHLVKPLDDSRAWAIAGIEQMA